MNVDETLADRETTHGDYVPQAEAAVRMVDCLNRTEGWTNTPKWMQYSIMMICMKLARIVYGNCRVADHWHDIQGYAKLVSNEIDGTGGRK